MALNNKGVILTMITIVVLTIFAASYTTYSLYQDREPINSRITTLNNFVTSIDSDMQRQLYISVYRAIFLFNKQIIDSGSYMQDIDSSLNEIFFNATLDGTTQDLMNDATFSSIENFFLTKAEKISATFNLENPTISISQEDPWYVTATLTGELNVQDKSNLASWNKTLISSAKIPVTSFNDPLYSVSTSSKIIHQINQTPYQTFVSGSNFSNLTNHFENSLYKASNSAPSFLMRLEGNFSASPYGIESLVNPQILADAGISAKYKSTVDYIYFSSYNPTAYQVAGVPNLILDNQDNHLVNYNVTSATPI